MIIRRAVESDLPRILACRVTGPISGVDAEVYRKNLASRSYRLEWTWIAEEDERIVARAVWWGFPQADHPVELDSLDAEPGVSDPVDVWGRMVAQAVHAWPPGVDAPSYQLFVPVDWRADHAVTVAVRWRLEAVERAGFTEVVERLRYEWTTEMPVPERSDRIQFIEGDDDAFVELFGRVALGSLDTETQRKIVRIGGEQAARHDLSVYSMMPGDRATWRLAVDAAGEVIGFAIPSANEAGPVIGYLGIVPEQRGRGYVDDLLAEATATLVAQGATRIVADTDAANVPMVAAFNRAGYRNFAVRLSVCPAVVPG